MSLSSKYQRDGLGTKQGRHLSDRIVPKKTLCSIAFQHLLYPLFTREGCWANNDLVSGREAIDDGGKRLLKEG